MERASRLLSRLAAAGDGFRPEDLARAAWPKAVGKKVAAHARAVRMVRTRLIVEVEDRVWQRQLFALSAQILKNLERQLGRGVVEDIEFREIPPRIGPVIAQTSGTSGDEADAIDDPVLRRIYIESRKKAQA